MVGFFKSLFKGQQQVQPDDISGLREQFGDSQQAYTSIQDRQILYNCGLLSYASYEVFNSEPEQGVHKRLQEAKHHTLDTSSLQLCVRNPAGTEPGTMQQEAHIIMRGKGDLAKCIYIACPGTVVGDGSQDIWTNLNFVARQANATSSGLMQPPFEAKFHGGFQKCAERLPVQMFFSLLTKGYDLVFTGHSKGAAVAAICAAQMLLGLKAREAANPDSCFKEQAQRIRCLGFGCPPFCDSNTIDEVHNHYGRQFDFFIMEKDPVPRLYTLLECIYQADGHSSLATEVFNHASFLGTSISVARFAASAGLVMGIQMALGAPSSDAQSTALANLDSVLRKSGANVKPLSTYFFGSVYTAVADRHATANCLGGSFNDMERVPLSLEPASKPMQPTHVVARQVLPGSSLKLQSHGMSVYFSAFCPPSTGPVGPERRNSLRGRIGRRSTNEQGAVATHPDDALYGSQYKAAFCFPDDTIWQPLRPPSYQKPIGDSSSSAAAFGPPPNEPHYGGRIIPAFGGLHEMQVTLSCPMSDGSVLVSAVNAAKIGVSLEQARVQLTATTNSSSITITASLTHDDLTRLAQKKLSLKVRHPYGECTIMLKIDAFNQLIQAAHKPKRETMDVYELYRQTWLSSLFTKEKNMLLTAYSKALDDAVRSRDNMIRREETVPPAMLDHISRLRNEIKGHERVDDQFIQEAFEPLLANLLLCASMRSNTKGDVKRFLYTAIKGTTGNTDLPNKLRSMMREAERWISDQRLGFLTARWRDLKSSTGEHMQLLPTKQADAVASPLIAAAVMLSTSSSSVQKVWQRWLTHLGDVVLALATVGVGNIVRYALKAGKFSGEAVKYWNANRVQHDDDYLALLQILAVGVLHLDVSGCSTHFELERLIATEGLPDGLLDVGSVMYKNAAQEIAKHLQEKESLRKKNKSTVQAFFGGLCDDSLNAAVTMLQMVVNNYLMRKQLLRRVRIGVLGSKNAGKSTLVEMLTGAAVGSGVTVHTTDVSIINVADVVDVIDFPHLDAVPDIAVTIEMHQDLADIIIVVAKMDSACQNASTNECIKRTHQGLCQKWNVGAKGTDDCPPLLFVYNQVDESLKKSMKAGRLTDGDLEGWEVAVDGAEFLCDESKLSRDMVRPTCLALPQPGEEHPVEVLNRILSARLPASSMQLGKSTGQWVSGAADIKEWVCGCLRTQFKLSEEDVAKFRNASVATKSQLQAE